MSTLLAGCLDKLERYLAVGLIAAARPYGDFTETVTADPVSGRTVVTNLRLPGQYDERLLGAVGMQGPYHNWNRWYLPGVGRYLELDPVALGGGLNGGFTPEWFTYGAQNPLTYTDPEGKQVAETAGGGALVCGPVCAAVGAGIGAAIVWVAACTASNTCPWSRPVCKNDGNNCEVQYATDLACATKVHVRQRVRVPPEELSIHLGSYQAWGARVRTWLINWRERRADRNYLRLRRDVVDTIGESTIREARS